jgi:hypothetical protein
MGGAAWLSIFGLGKASTREHIRPAAAGRPGSNATQGKKQRHPQGKSTSQRLAALLAPYRPGRVCASLAPCQPPRIALARSPPVYEMASIGPRSNWFPESRSYHWRLDPHRVFIRYLLGAPKKYRNENTLECESPHALFDLRYTRARHAAVVVRGVWALPCR